MSSGAVQARVVPVLCNREVWQSSDMTYPAVNDPNITSGFTFNKRSVSLASELRSFVVLRPSPDQSAPSAARYNTNLSSAINLIITKNKHYKYIRIIKSFGGKSANAYLKNLLENQECPSASPRELHIAYPAPFPKG